MKTIQENQRIIAELLSEVLNRPAPQPIQARPYTVSWMRAVGQSIVEPHEKDADGSPKLTGEQT